MSTPPPNLDAHLPLELHGATIWKITQGLSGAGVYGVEKAGRRYVLKFSATATLSKLVSDAGVAPRVVHSDAETVTCELVDNKQFFAFLAQARERALDDLGAMLARLHRLPIPAGMARQSKRGFLDILMTQLGEFPVPPWFRQHVAELRALAEPDVGAVVLSHNDVNPMNVVWDGARVLLLDWDVAGPSDRYYDLASASVFFRLDEAQSLRLLSAHDGAPVTALPPRFTYDRLLIGALLGTMFMNLARQHGHAGDPGAAAPPLVELYAGLREGTLDPSTADGQFALGLALLVESRSMIRSEHGPSGGAA